DGAPRASEDRGTAAVARTLIEADAGDPPVDRWGELDPRLAACSRYRLVPGDLWFETGRGFDTQIPRVRKPVPRAHTVTSSGLCLGRRGPRSHGADDMAREEAVPVAMDEAGQAPVPVSRSAPEPPLVPDQSNEAVRTRRPWSVMRRWSPWLVLAAGLAGE